MRIVGGLIAIPILITVLAYLGYFFGILVSFVTGEILAGAFGIVPQDIPLMMAWLFVVAPSIGWCASRLNEEASEE